MRKTAEEIQGGRLLQTEWFDQLLTVGWYKGLDVVFPCQRLRLWYEPGTMVVFSGCLLVHGAENVAGERACLTWYMQWKVHSTFNIPDYDYAKLGHE